MDERNQGYGPWHRGPRRPDWQGPEMPPEGGEHRGPGPHMRQHHGPEEGFEDMQMNLHRSISHMRHHLGPDEGFPGFGFHRRRQGRGGPRVGRGDVRGAALLLLSERPMHGYQIIQEIGERSHEMWRPSAGSIYPALQMMEDEGLVRAEESEGRRIFSLTEKGRTYVSERQDELTAARDAVMGAVDTGVVALHDLARQVEIALRQVAQVGSQKQIVAARDLMADTRRKLYRLLAEDETASDKP